MSSLDLSMGASPSLTETPTGPGASFGIHHNKILGIVGGFSVLALAVAGIGLYGLHVDNEQVSAVTRAFDPALPGEQTDKFVTAVVRDSHEIYVTADRDDSEKYSRTLPKSLDALQQAAAAWMSTAPENGEENNRLFGEETPQKAKAFGDNREKILGAPVKQTNERISILSRTLGEGHDNLFRLLLTICITIVVTGIAGTAFVLRKCIVNPTVATVGAVGSLEEKILALRRYDEVDPFTYTVAAGAMIISDQWVSGRDIVNAPLVTGPLGLPISSGIVGDTVSLTGSGHAVSLGGTNGALGPGASFGGAEAIYFGDQGSSLVIPGVTTITSTSKDPAIITSGSELTGDALFPLEIASDLSSGKARFLYADTAMISLVNDYDVDISQMSLLDPLGYKLSIRLRSTAAKDWIVDPSVALAAPTMPLTYFKHVQSLGIADNDAGSFSAGFAGMIDVANISLGMDELRFIGDANSVTGAMTINNTGNSFTVDALNAYYGAGGAENLTQNLTNQDLVLDLGAINRFVAVSLGDATFHMNGLVVDKTPGDGAQANIGGADALDINQLQAPTTLVNDIAQVWLGNRAFLTDTDAAAMTIFSTTIAGSVNASALGDILMHGGNPFVSDADIDEPVFGSATAVNEQQRPLANDIITDAPAAGEFIFSQGGAGTFNLASGHFLGQIIELNDPFSAAPIDQQGHSAFDFGGFVTGTEDAFGLDLTESGTFGAYRDQSTVYGFTAGERNDQIVIDAAPSVEFGNNLGLVEGDGANLIITIGNAATGAGSSGALWEA